MSRNLHVLAVASAGGHWIQLMRLRPSWAGLKVTYVTTDPGLKTLLEQDAADTGDNIAGFHAVVDANMNAKVQLLRQLLQLVGVFWKCRPDVVITTGAAPGYFAVRLGRLIGARTIWIDSIANADELSLSGKRLKNHADVWLTQWEHLERPEGPVYLGSVI